MRFTKNQKITIGAVGSLMVIIILGIVYAAFTQQLSINGTATGRSSSWRVYFSSLSNVSLTGTAKELTAPQIDSDNQTSIGNYSVSVTTPGDTVEYAFDVTNSGDYDATLTGLTKNNPTCTGTGETASTDASNVCGKLTYTLKYADGTAVTQNDTLKSKETKTMKLKLTYQEFADASLLPKQDVTINGLGITLTYSQDGNAKVNSDGSTPYIKPYEVGDEITVANEQYYVISVPENEDYVVALKANPLTTGELASAGATNVYDIKRWDEQTGRYVSTGYGRIVYGSDSTYATSAVKSVVDSWAASKFTDSELKTVDGYGARLISFDEAHSFGYGDEPQSPCGPSCGVLYYPKTDAVPDWLWNNNYTYWTMTPKENSSSIVWGVRNDGNLCYGNAAGDFDAVRPVINVYKSKISS